MIRFEDLIEKVRATNPDADVELLRRAYVFSAYEHKGQVRHSGEPYLVHPLEVADLLADMKLDVVAVAAGLLHDIVEDTQTPIERTRSSSGRHRARVEGGTKLGRSVLVERGAAAENFRKMMLQGDDIRVICEVGIAKNADAAPPPEERGSDARDADIYAPIATGWG